MRAWTLASRPVGLPNDNDFAMVEHPDAPLGADEFRVTNSWLSVDPYMRGRMNDARSYAPPQPLNQVMVDESTALADGAEVAFFPPVTGG